MKWTGAAGIVIQDNKVLMVKTQYHDGWSVPTGGKENDEKSSANVKREVYEETGYHINIVRHIERIYKVVDDMDVSVDYYLCEVDSYDNDNIDPEDEIEEVRWIDLEELNTLELMYPEDKVLIEKYLK